MPEHITASERKPGIVEFLKTQSIFSVLEEKTIEEVCPLLSEVNCGPGHVVFSEGDPADALYIIRQGSVEVLISRPEKRVVAYLTAGECFGEMAIIHETSRNATIRVPEGATILRLPSLDFKKLTKTAPQITAEIAELINKRLSGSIPFHPPGLTGNLAFFDLPTVIQTIIGSRKDGMLTLFGRGGKAVSYLRFQQGNLNHASYEHLAGEDALFELMYNSDPLDFVFDQKDNPDIPKDIDLSKKPAHMLLIEGARRQDELPKLMKEVGWPAFTFSQLKTIPNLAELAHGKLDQAKVVWSLIEMGGTVEEIAKQVKLDRYTLLTLLQEMLQAGQISKESARHQTDDHRKTTSMLQKPGAQKAPEKRAEQDESLFPRLNRGEHGFEVVKLVNAINSIGTNLGTILGKMEVRSVLAEALVRSEKIFPTLGSITVYPDSPALDLRRAEQEFSESDETAAALHHLTALFIRLVASITM